MNLEIIWSYPALYDLRSIHWIHGAEVDAAILHFAATGKGTLVQVPDRPCARAQHPRG